MPDVGGVSATSGGQIPAASLEAPTRMVSQITLHSGMPGDACMVLWFINALENLFRREANNRLLS